MITYVNVNNFGVRAWIVTDQFCWITLHFSLPLWISLAGNLVWVGGGGDYSTEVINGGMAIIGGNTVLLLDERVS